MPPELILAILSFATPLVRQILADWKKAHGSEPTDAQIIAEFNNNIDKYLAEGAAWKATHPK